VDLRQFEVELRSRGGVADVWLVYVEDSYESVVRGVPTLKLRRAFWTRGGAYAFAYAAHEESRWRHYHVFRVSADVAWLQSGEPSAAEFETTFGRERELGMTAVTPTELVGVLESAC
jgi:hypothetical protein